ncbi:sugar kinase [Paenibacillus sp. HB172176]|uniref:sugar kinase n=1 Tax=Paenibacillus sp. HB172176 TaxID=2493690 RepID=UPI00143B0C55|nr:sugar kinase [Paenibacillus sp. HB172176]
MSKITAFGEVMMRLEAPRYATLAQSSTLNYSFSGTGVNVASALTRYGHSGRVASVLPDNPLGDAAVGYLRRLGVDTRYIARGGRYIGSYFLEHGFGARPSRVTYTDRWGSSFNTADFPDELLAGAAADSDAVHFCGITLAMNDRVRDAMKRFARFAKDAGKTIIFDCNYRPSLWGEGGYELARPHYREMLAFADIVFMNERDAIHILEMPTGKKDRMAQLQELIPQAAEQYGLRTVAGTHRSINADGTHELRGYLHKAGQFSFAKPLVFAVHDRVGAGDAYASGIIHGELQGADAAHTVSFASAAAMLAHTVEGDTPLATEREVLEAMREGISDVRR